MISEEGCADYQRDGVIVVPEVLGAVYTRPGSLGDRGIGRGIGQNP